MPLLFTLYYGSSVEKSTALHNDSLGGDNFSHALHVEFMNAEPTTPVSDSRRVSASPQSDTPRAAPLAQATYPNLWRARDAGVGLRIRTID